MEKTPKVFVSYSWTNQEHVEKVLHLCMRLADAGIDVRLDKWDLNPGHDKYVFMETMVNDPNVDKVLMICDRRYQMKANERSGGVGDETQIITPQLYNQVQQTKFIPIVFENDEHGNPCLPAYLSNRIYIDFSDAETYEERLVELIRHVFEKPLYQKPAIGKPPAWLDEAPDMAAVFRDKWRTGAQRRGGPEASASEQSFRLELIEILKGFSFYNETADRYTQPTGERIVERIERMKGVRDVILDQLQQRLDRGEMVAGLVASLIEAINDELIYPSSAVGIYEGDNDHFRFLLWELILCSVALLRYYERYGEIHNLLTRTYFFKNRHQDSVPCHIDKLNFHSRLIEGKYKEQSSSPNLFSMMSNMLMAREKRPVITAERLVEADLIIFEVIRFCIGVEHQWFPRTYVYQNKVEAFWVRMTSKRECEKYLCLFGLTDIESFKKRVEQLGANGVQRYSYPMAHDRPTLIIDSITADAIASMA